MLRFPDFRFMLLVALALVAMESYVWVFTGPMIEKPDELKISLIIVLLFQLIVLPAAYWSAWIVAWVIFRLRRPQRQVKL